MAAIAIDPANRFLQLVCGAGEDDVTFNVSDIYVVWKDWFLLGDNLKYDPAMDSTGGNATGGGESLDNVWFLLCDNNWRIAPNTTEPDTRIVLVGDLFPQPSTARLFDYSLAGGNVYIETRLSTKSRVNETGVSGLTPQESTLLTQAADLAGALEGGLSFADGLRLMLAILAGKATVPTSTGSFAFRNQADTKNRVAGTVDESGNRTLTEIDGT